MRESLTEILVGGGGEGRKEKSALYDFPDFQELTNEFSRGRNFMSRLNKTWLLVVHLQKRDSRIAEVEMFRRSSRESAL